MAMRTGDRRAPGRAPDRRTGLVRRDSDARQAREALTAALLAVRPGTVTHYEESTRVELRGNLTVRINYQGSHVIIEADNVPGALACDIIELMNTRLVAPLTD